MVPGPVFAAPGQVAGQNRHSAGMTPRKALPGRLAGPSHGLGQGRLQQQLERLGD